MNPRQINRFFEILAEELGEKATAYLTGAAAGALLGQIRPSVDVDFAIDLTKRNKTIWQKFEEAAERTVQRTGIQVNYAEDIDRWGLIALLDYKTKSKPYRRFGPFQLRVLDPGHWSIGKMTRYLDFDISDMITIFKKQRVKPDYLARLWGRALHKSPRSMALNQFRKQVEDFFKTYGKRIWGSQFSPKLTINQFLKSAGIESK